MRTEAEMMDLIIKKAAEDERIRAVAMDGSRANKNAVHDEYSDFDIVYFVTDVREFTRDKSWVDYFGDILIVQYPADWYKHPYDYDSHDSFAFLMQFADGNRIDLTIVDVRNIEKEKQNAEPRIVLLNKDNFSELIPLDSEKAFYIKPPSKMEFDNVCNEFRWLSVYITKGLCRDEFYYARHIYEVPIMEMFMKMLNWKIGILHGFNVSTGAHGKYLKRFLTRNEMNRFRGIFPNGEYKDIWDKLFLMYDYFDELETEVADGLGFQRNREETEKVRAFLEARRSAKEM